MESTKSLKRACTDASKEARRKSILNAATKLFFANPNELPTVSAISKNCNIAKGTIYLYFKTKEKIFLNIIDDLFNDFIATAKKIILDSKDNPNNIDAIIDGVCDYFDNNKNMIILAGMTNTIIEHNIDPEAALVHKVSLQTKLLELGKTLSEVIERDQIFCASLLLRTYATTVGISRISNLTEKVSQIHKSEGAEFLAPKFRPELYNTLKCLWKGSLAD